MKTFVNYLLFFSVILSPYFTSANTIHAVNNGDWQDISTWSGGIPSSGDSVVIQDMVVTIGNLAGIVNVQAITLLNSNKNDSTALIITDDAKLTVTNNVELIVNNLSLSDVILKTLVQSDLNIVGDLIITRSLGNTSNSDAKLLMYNESTLKVGTNFDYHFHTSAIGLSPEEMVLQDSATLSVEGNLNLNGSGGKHLELIIKESSTLNVSGDLNMNLTAGEQVCTFVKDKGFLSVIGNIKIENTGGSGQSYLETDGSNAKITIGTNLNLISGSAGRDVKVKLNDDNNILEVNGNINLTADGDADAGIEMVNGTELHLGGDLIRADYGYLTMLQGSTLIYNGSISQSIAQANIDDSGSDSLHFDNIKFENTSGIPLELDKDWLITDTLILASGIIKTSTDHSLIIGDGAVVIGGNANAFIDGPLIKRGSTNGKSFIFPIGQGSSYAPIEISEISNANDEYTAKYFGCPPPIKEDVIGTLDHISSLEYWSLIRDAVDSVDVILHWEDADASGIDDLATLVVAYLDESSGWKALDSLGITTGGTGNNRGTVTNDSGCPPPIYNKFTFGSTSPSTNSLPVELLRFNAAVENTTVVLDWETALEVNSDYFDVERSADGINFKSIDQIRAKGNTTGNTLYTSIDQQPLLDYNYYRLKQVDDDGSFEYSEIITLNVETNANIQLFPNPINDYFQINLDEASNNIRSSIEIRTQNGLLVYSGTAPVQNGVIYLATSNLKIFSPGLYFINIQSPFSNCTKSFVKNP